MCYLHPYPEGFMPLIPALESFFYFFYFLFPLAMVVSVLVTKKSKW